MAGLFCLFSLSLVSARLEVHLGAFLLNHILVSSILALWRLSDMRLWSVSFLFSPYAPLAYYEHLSFTFGLCQPLYCPSFLSFFACTFPFLRLLFSGLASLKLFIMNAYT